MKAPDVDPSGKDRADGSNSSVATSLLLRLKGDDAVAWQRLMSLYGPSVYGWCRHAGLSPEDAADVGQEVFRAVARRIADFRRDRPGDSFRGWLWRITHNKILDHWRRNDGHVEAAGGSSAQQRLLQVPDPVGADSEASPAPEEANSLYQRALDLIQTEFEERTWRAFLLVSVEGRTAEEAAAALGMSQGAVYVNKSRVLRRLKEEFSDLIP